LDWTTTLLAGNGDDRAQQRPTTITTTTTTTSERGSSWLVAALLGLAELLGADHHSLTSSTKIIHKIFIPCVKMK